MAEKSFYLLLFAIGFSWADCGCLWCALGDDGDAVFTEGSKMEGDQRTKEKRKEDDGKALDGFFFLRSSSSVSCVECCGRF
jgi:hypothetical protein